MGSDGGKSGIDPTKITAYLARRLPRGIVARFNPAVRLMRDSAAEAQRTRLPQMAAALSYRTIFGLIPVIVVGLVVLRAFVLKTDDQIASAVGQAMQYTGLSSIAIEREPQGEMGPFPENYSPPPTTEASATTAATTGEPNADPNAPRLRHRTGSARLDQWITRLVTRVSKIDFGTIGIIGAGALLYAAIGMLVEIERCFNQVFRVPIGRSWARRVTQYWTLLTLGTFGLVATFYVGQKLSAWLTARFAGTAGELSSVAKSAGATLRFDLIGAATTMPITALLFLLLYTVVPNTRVRLWSALGGAAIGAVLFEVGKLAFAQYVKFSTGYAQLYGSIALIPLFMMWVYVMWCIVLFGLNVTYFLQHGRHHTTARALELTPAFVDPAAIVSVMARVAADFQKGSHAGAAEIAKDLRVQEGMVAALLERLASGGFVHRIAAADGEKLPRYVAARPPERIDAAAVLALGEEMGDAGSGGPTSGVGQALRAARQDAVRGKSIADFLTDHSRSSEPHAARTPAPGAPGALPSAP